MWLISNATKPHFTPVAARKQEECCIETKQPFPRPNEKFFFYERKPATAKLSTRFLNPATRSSVDGRCEFFRDLKTLTMRFRKR